MDTKGKVMSEEEKVALEGEDTTQEEDLKDSFLKNDDKDMHRLSSALGRALKQQGELVQSKKEQEAFNKQVMSTLQAIEEKFSQKNPEKKFDLSTLNEDLSSKILSGNVIEALDYYSDLRNEAQQNISKANMSKVNSLIGNLKDEPFFNDLQENVRNDSVQLVQSGKDPETAVQMAYQKHRGDYLVGLVATIHSTNPQALKVARGGGKAKEEGNKGKLPPEFEARMKKDMAELKDSTGKPLFKTEQDWIGSLSPQVRQHLGV
jgi:hypothetical protein